MCVVGKGGAGGGGGGRRGQSLEKRVVKCVEGGCINARVCKYDCECMFACSYGPARMFLSIVYVCNLPVFVVNLDTAFNLNN